MAKLGVRRKGGHEGANKARHSKDGSCKAVQAAPEDVWGVNQVQAQQQHPSLTGSWWEGRASLAESSPACPDCPSAQPPTVGARSPAQGLARVRWPSKCCPGANASKSAAHSVYSFRNEPGS